LWAAKTREPALPGELGRGSGVRFAVVLVLERGSVPPAMEP